MVAVFLCRNHARHTDQRDGQCNATPCHGSVSFSPSRVRRERGAGALVAAPRPRPGLVRYSALTGICVPLAPGAFGRVTVSTPFLKPAVTLVPSTADGTRTVRAKAPYDRSAR